MIFLGYEDQQPKCTGKTPHHFFKIILEDSLRDGKLKIPKKFSDKFGDAMPSLVELRAPYGTAWKVEVRKSSNEIWLRSGWREFAEHYSLSHGHLVVFRYEGDDQFHVVIFDGTASEIDYPLDCSHDEASNLREGDVEETGDDCSSLEILESSEWPCRKRRERSQLECPKASKSMRNNSTSEKVGDHNAGLFTDHLRSQQKEVPMITQPLTADEKSKALQMASSFKSKNPFFVVVMHPSYINFTCKLTIPTRFVRKFFIKKCGEVILQVSDGRSWTVGYKVVVQDHRTYGKLDQKLKDFVQDNNLKVCDVCVFELIDRTKLLFRIVIYRKDDRPGCFQAQVGANCSTKIVREGVSMTALEGLNSDANQSIQSPSPKEIAFQRATAFNSENPFFMVVMKPYYIHKKCHLYIPIKFAERHLKASYDDVHLQVPDGRTWDVKCYVNVYNRSVKTQFTSGWKAFVEDNKLKVGDACFFELIKGPKISFNVVVHRATEDSNHGSGTGCGGECKNLASKTGWNTKQYPRSVTSICKFAPKNPFFLVVVGSCFRRHSMRMPTGFFKEYINKYDIWVTLKTAGKSWPMKLVKCCGSFRLSAGWSVFARENSLQPEDICAFELIKRSDMVLKVSIFQCSQH